MKRLIILGALIPTIALAEVTPRPGPRDPQIQTVDYDPDQVVRLATSPGYLLVVELSSDERIETMAMGDNSAWQVTTSKRGNLIFVKQDAGAADTNLSVITDARRYTFILAPNAGADARIPYNVKFRYPGVDVAPVVTVEEAKRSYRYSGPGELRPVEMFDNGLATSIRWPANAALPAVYALDGDDHEMIINGAMRGTYYVIDAVAPKFRFRLGDRVAQATRRSAGKRK